MMKKTGKIIVAMTSLGVLLNNVAFATTELVGETKEGLPTKYIFIGIAALVIVLLLFLGYKMDTKDNSSKKVSHKAEKTMKKLSAKAEAMQQNSGEYELDNEGYESDDEEFDNEELNDSVEYKEDDEDSLFSAAEEDDDDDNFANNSPVVVDSEEPETKEELEAELKEKSNEEFDTSIIDGLDDEDNVGTKKSFDDTMLFNNSDFSFTGSSLEEEIDNLDNFNDISIEEKKQDNSFIDELKSFEKPATSFEGFSVEPVEDEIENMNVEEKVEDTDKNLSSNIDTDFLSQMEANFKKNKEARNAKKENLNKKED